MGRRRHQIFSALFFAGALMSVFFAAQEELPYQEAELESAQLAAEYVSEPEEASDDTDTAPFGIEIDFEGLKEMNGDIVGWIYIPGTQVNYPILQHPSDNTFYLHHTPGRAENMLGSVYMYAEMSADFSDAHNILFGHNMASGQQFGELSNYADREFRDKYPYVYIFLPGRSLCCEIYSAYSCSVYDRTYMVGYAFESQDFAEFITHSTELSLWQTEVRPSSAETVITLSTCTDDSDDYRRFAVNCVVIDKR